MNGKEEYNSEENGYNKKSWLRAGQGGIKTQTH